MKKKREAIVELFEPFKEKTFISIKHCNYIGAVAQFLEQHEVLLEKSDFVEGEKSSYIDRYGVFKYKNTIKIKSLNLKLQVSCFYQKEWEFQFDLVLPPHVAIAKERVIQNNEPIVLVSYVNDDKQKTLYAVPIALAESLDLEEFHEKNIEKEAKKDILTTLAPYEVVSMINLKP